MLGLETIKLLSCTGPTSGLSEHWHALSPNPISMQKITNSFRAVSFRAVSFRIDFGVFSPLFRVN